MCWERALSADISLFFFIQSSPHESEVRPQPLLLPLPSLLPPPFDRPPIGSTLYFFSLDVSQSSNLDICESCSSASGSLRPSSTGMEGNLELRSRSRSVLLPLSTFDICPFVLTVSPFLFRSCTGFPDFYPSRPAHGQDEDCLSEAFVKQGYVSRWGISQAVRLPPFDFVPHRLGRDANLTLLSRYQQSESFTVHGVLLKEIGSQAGLARMGSTLSSLLSTRQASASSIGFVVPFSFPSFQVRLS